VYLWNDMPRPTIVVACFVVAACGKNPPRGPARPSDAATSAALTPVRTAPAPAAPSPAAPSNKVALLDPGRAPRAPLRYAFEAGTHQAIVAIADSTAGTDAPLRAYRAIDVQVAEVFPDGSARLDVAVGRDSMPGEAPDRRELHIDPQGQLVDDGRADNSIGVDTLLAALPLEPVGVGARWRTRHPYAGDSSITYELIALEPGGAHLRETTSYFEPREEVGDATVWAIEVTAQRTGDLHVAWNRVVARADWDTTESTRRRPRDILTGEARAESVQAMTIHLANVPADAFAPPAFFPGDVGPVLMGMVPMWLPIGLPLCAAPDGPLSGPFASQYPDGTPAVSGACTDGRPTGAWRWWDARGDLISEGHFHLGNPDGTWTQWRQGRSLGSFTMHDGTGVVSAWWPDGAKRLEVGFAGGVPHGAVTAWRADGTRELAGHFETPRGQGTWAAFDMNGHVSRAWTLNEAGRPVP
jgi:hypothetical protein